MGGRISNGLMTLKSHNRFPGDLLDAVSRFWKVDNDNIRGLVGFAGI